MLHLCLLKSQSICSLLSVLPGAPVGKSSGSVSPGASGPIHVDLEDASIWNSKGGFCEGRIVRVGGTEARVARGLSTPSPSGKRGLFSGCFSALYTIHSKNVQMVLLWNRRSIPPLPTQKFRKNTDETKLTEAERTSDSTPSSSKPRASSTERNIIPVSGLSPKGGDSPSEPNSFRDKLREPKQNPVLGGTILGGRNPRDPFSGHLSFKHNIYMGKVALQ